MEDDSELAITRTHYRSISKPRLQHQNTLYYSIYVIFIYIYIYISRLPHSCLRELSTREWIRRRTNDMTSPLIKPEYLNAPYDLMQHRRIERLFNYFDTDRSGICSIYNN